jgi:hypothetical protein
MSVKFSDLKRKKIRKTFGEGEFAVEVYNPSPEQQNQITQMFLDKLDKNEEIEIDGKLVLLKLIPMLTNIDLDLDENDDLVEEILNDPSEILELVTLEITDIIQSIVNKTIKNIENLANLPKEQLEKVLQENKSEEETKKEQEERELYEKLKAKFEK